MAFMKRGKGYYSFFIERDGIFSPRPRFIAFTISCDLSLFEGTLIEGTMVIDSNTKNQVFIMQDVHLLCGVQKRSEPWYEKMNKLSSEIDSKIKLEPFANRFDIAIDTGKSISELRSMIERGTSHLAWNTRGLLFVPERSNALRWSFVEDIAHAPAIGSSESETASLIAPDGAETAVLEMHKSTLPQVYELYATDRKPGKRRHLGLAGVPTIATSRFCTAIFEQEERRKRTDVKQVMMLCYYDEEHENWVPYQHVPTRRSPDKIKAAPAPKAKE
jgi:hypothetical protein